jgi:hypothetical protein
VKSVEPFGPTLQLVTRPNPPRHVVQAGSPLIEGALQCLFMLMRADERVGLRVAEQNGMSGTLVAVVRNPGRTTAGAVLRQSRRPTAPRLIERGRRCGLGWGAAMKGADDLGLSTGCYTLRMSGSCRFA